MTSDRPNYVAGVGYSNPSCVEARGNMATDNLDMSDPELKTAFDQFTASEINWLLYGYVPKSNKLKLYSSGTESLDEMVAELNDSRVLYGLLRFEYTPGQKKIVYITWAGEAASPVIKGQITRHSDAIAKFLKPFHLQINAREESDLSEDIVRGRLAKCSASGYGPGY